MSKGRLLVVHTGGIGDFLLFCPTLRRLSGDYGADNIELLGRPERLELAVEAGLAHATHDIERSQFESLFTHPHDRIRAFLARFDACIAWMRDDGTLQRAVSGCGVRESRFFPGLPPENWARHASAYYAECLGYPEPVYGEGRPLLELAPALEMPGYTVDMAIHPGSGSPRKNWPIENFLAVARRLEAEGRRVDWLLGPAEEALVRQLTGEMLPHTRGGRGKERPILTLSRLIDMARVLAGARQYIGNDSGISHLAAAVGCPTIAIFGPTNPAVWAPRGHHVHVITGIPWPSREDVQSLLVRERNIK